jgi:hypothetical protein
MRSLIVLLVLITSNCLAGESAAERFKCEIAKKYGLETDVKLPDGLVAVGMARNAVVEPCYSDEWQKTIGVLLQKALIVGKAPVLIILQRSPSEGIDVMRCKVVCQMIGVNVVVEDVSSSPTLPPKQAPKEAHAPWPQ